MDIVEFAEHEYSVELMEWQKNYLRTLDQLYGQCENGNGDVRIVMLPRGVGRMFTYFKLKELVPSGKTNDRK